MASHSENRNVYVVSDDSVFDESTIPSYSVTGSHMDVGMTNVNVVNSHGVQIGDNKMMRVVQMGDKKVNLAEFRSKSRRCLYDNMFDDIRIVGGKVGNHRDVDAFTRQFDDIRVKGEPVRVTETSLDELNRKKRSNANLAIASAVPAGVIASRRCFCHGIVGRYRYCVSDPVGPKDFPWKCVDKLERMIHEMNRTGPVPLFREIVKLSGHLAVNDLSLDSFLAECYCHTNFRRDTYPLEKFYYTCKGVQSDVSGFFRSFEPRIVSILNSVRKDLPPLTTKGLLSTVIYLDQICNSFDGREECAMGACMRTAAMLTVRCFEGALNPAVLMANPPGDAASVFEMIFRLLYSQSVIPPLNVLAYAGLSQDIPLFASVSCELVDKGPECLFNVSLKTVCAMLTNGVSVSLSLENSGDDCEMIMRFLGSQCSVLRRSQRVPASVRVFTDIWSVKCLQMFSFIQREAAEYDGLTYGVRIPDLFMRRRTIADSSWSCFLYPDTLELLRRISDRFDSMYEDMEVKRNAVMVSTDWMMSTVARCVPKGMGVVFSDRNRSLVVDKDRGEEYTCFSPDLSCRTVLFGDVHPAIRCAVNLENCVLCTDRDLSADTDVIVGKNGRCLDLRDLRNLVRDAVVFMNCMLTTEIKKNTLGGIDYLVKYRPLSLGIVGLHTVFAKLGIGYGFVECLDVNRRIFENVYFSAVRASVDLCIAGFPPFPEYARSIYSQGKLHFDHYDNVRLSLPLEMWTSLRRDMVRYGLHNGQFVALGACEEESKLANVSCGFWPRDSNVTFEESALLATKAHEKSVSDVGALRRRFGLDRRYRNDEALVRMVKPDKVKIAVVNRVLADVPKGKVMEVMRRCGDLEPHEIAVSDVDMSDVALECFYPSHKLGRKIFLKMCGDRAPFVDQGQAIPILIDRRDDETEVIRQLVMSHEMGLIIGVYKCCVRSGQNR
nr:MAG: protein m45 [Herpesviridae sp.]